MAACLLEAFGTGPSEAQEDQQQLASRVKALQRAGGPAKEAWWLYCRKRGSSVCDPTRHPAKFLKGFLQSLNASSEGAGSAEQGQPASEDEAKLDFVARVKELQRSSPETRQMWHDWCQKHAAPGVRGGGPSLDPSRHDEDLLRRFLEAFDSGELWGGAAGCAGAGAAGGGWCGWGDWTAAGDPGVGAGAGWPGGTEGKGGYAAGAPGAASWKGWANGGACGFGGKGGAAGCSWGGKGDAVGSGWGGKGGDDGSSCGNKGDWGQWSGADGAAWGVGKGAWPWEGSGGADSWWPSGKGCDAAAWWGCDSCWGGGSDSAWPPTWSASVQGADFGAMGKGAAADLWSAASGLRGGGMCGLMMMGGKGEKGIATPGGKGKSEFGILDVAPPADLLSQKRGAVSSPAAVASGNNSPGLMTEEQAIEFQRMLKRAKR